MEPQTRASKLACQALNLAPLGSATSHPDRCALCGGPIAAGDAIEPWKPGPNFLDHPSTGAACTLEPFDGHHACGECARMATKPVMEALGYACITADAAYPLATDVQRSWLLTEPPEPPFVVVIRTAQLQHLVWRAPVTLSRELIRACIGGHTVPIRRPLVWEALERIDTHLGGRHPFIRLDRNGDHPAHGRLRTDLDPASVRWFRRLGPGELWALSVLAKRNPPTPTRGEPIAVKR